MGGDQHGPPVAEPGKKWEQEEDQEMTGPEDQDGLHIKKAGALLELTKGL